MTEKINQKPNGKAIVVYQSKHIKRSFRRGDYTRPVSFITETEVYRLADVAETMRHGERNELLNPYHVSGSATGNRGCQVAGNRQGYSR